MLKLRFQAQKDWNTAISGDAEAPRAGLKPLVVAQPDGPSFQVTGREVPDAAADMGTTWYEPVATLGYLAAATHRVRLMTNVVECAPDTVRVGMPVEVVFHDVTPEMTLPMFRPV